jgi:hypothetical protein
VTCLIVSGLRLLARRRSIDLRKTLKARSAAESKSLRPLLCFVHRFFLTRLDRPSLWLVEAPIEPLLHHYLVGIKPALRMFTRNLLVAVTQGCGPATCLRLHSVQTLFFRFVSRAFANRLGELGATGIYSSELHELLRSACGLAYMLAAPSAVGGAFAGIICSRRKKALVIS